MRPNCGAGSQVLQMSQGSVSRERFRLFRFSIRKFLSSSAPTGAAMLARTVRQLVWIR